MINEKVNTHTVFFLTSGFLNEGILDLTECEKMRLSRWVCDLGSSMLCVMCEQTVPRAAVHCEITA